MPNPFVTLPVSRPLRAAGLLAVLLGALCAATSAQAVDAVAGRSLYNNSVGPGGSTCSASSCHGVNPARGANKIRNGANNPAAIQRGISNDSGGMRVYNGRFTSLDLANLAAYIGVTASVTPTSLSFASVAVGSSGAGQTVTVTSQGVTALRITSLASNSSDFVIGGGSCSAGGTVAGFDPAAGKYSSCTVVITFAPQAAGPRSGTLSIGTSDPALPTATVQLSGSGTAALQPNAAITPTSIAYGAATVGTQSAAQTVSLSNTGSAPLNLSSIGTGTADFAVSGGSCAVGTPVPAGGACTLLLRFAPQSAGAKSATLRIVHDAANSPSTVVLSGTGVDATPLAQITPASLTFSQTLGSPSPAQTVTLANAGTAPLVLSTVSLSGAQASEFALAGGSTCANGTSIAPGSNCVLRVTFTPTATGARSASLGIVHNDAAHSPSVVSLAGTGTAAPAGQVSLNRTSMAFVAQAQGSVSPAQTVTVSNSGSAPLLLSAIDLGGANAGDYAIDAAGSSCSTSTLMAVGSSCTVAIRFAPTASSGTRVASLTVSSASSASSASMSISGTAAPVAAPLLSLAPSGLDFGGYAIGTSSPTRTVSLSNAGNAALALSSVSASPADYRLTHDCPASLAAGASCTLSLRFVPSTAGMINGAVSVVSNAASSPDAVALTGSGLDAAPALLAWQAGSDGSFPDTTVFGTATAQALMLINEGGVAAQLQQLQIAGPDAADFALDPASTCAAGVTLAAGASCSVMVTFTPSGGGPRAATLDVTSDASGPGPAALSGNGVANGSPVLSLSPLFLNLAGPPNQGLQSQSLVIRNDGAGVLSIVAIRASSGIAVLTAGAAGGGSCPGATFDLQPGTSCSVVIEPQASSPISASIEVVSNAADTPTVVTVSGVELHNAGAAGGGALDLAWLSLCTAWLCIRRRRAS